MTLACKSGWISTKCWAMPSSISGGFRPRIWLVHFDKFGPRSADTDQVWPEFDSSGDGGPSAPCSLGQPSWWDENSSGTDARPLGAGHAPTKIAFVGGRERHVHFGQHLKASLLMWLVQAVPRSFRCRRYRGLEDLDNTRRSPHCSVLPLHMNRN